MFGEHRNHLRLGMQQCSVANVGRRQQPLVYIAWGRGF